MFIHIIKFGTRETVQLHVIYNLSVCKNKGKKTLTHEHSKYVFSNSIKMAIKLFSNENEIT